MGGSQGAKRVALHRLQQNGGVCLTTYGMLPKMGDLYPGSIVAPGSEEEGEASWHCAILDEAQELIAKPTGTRSRHLEELGHAAQFLVLLPEEGGAIHPVDAGARWPGMEFEVIQVLAEASPRWDHEEDAVGLTQLQVEQFVSGAMVNQRTAKQVLDQIMQSTSVV